MTIHFCSTKSFGRSEQEKIAELISARVVLLVGEKYSSHIDSISFCTDLSDCKRCETNFLINEQAVIELNTPKKKAIFACIRLSETLLWNTLIPGPGQSQFDELFLKIRNVLSERM